MKYNTINLRKKADEIKEKTIEMILNAKSGHLASSLSVIDILISIYYGVKKDKDIVILSKGHAAPALYSILIDMKKINEKEFNLLRNINGILEGHPSLDISGVDAPSGSLGTGFAFGVGRAMGKKIKNEKGFVYVIVGDGELQEGICWELLAISFHRRLDNLILIVDRNGLQLSGTTEKILYLEPLEEKLKSFGFYVENVDGHNIKEIVSSLERCKSIEGFPKIIIADTIKGKGVLGMEWKVKGHSMKIKEIEEIIKKEWEE